MEYNPTISDEEIERFGAGALRKAAQEGNETEGCFMAGQCAGLVTKIQPAKEIIEGMISQAENLLKNSHQLLY